MICDDFSTMVQLLKYKIQLLLVYELLVKDRCVFEILQDIFEICLVMKLMSRHVLNASKLRMFYVWILFLHCLYSSSLLN